MVVKAALIQSVAPAEPDPTGQELLDALAAFAAAKERDLIARALDAARQRLHMDAAYVSTITPDLQRVDAVTGDTSPFGIGEGTTAPLAETYCSRMLSGELPNLVPDTALEPSVQGLAATAVVGAYAGVPIRLADGRLHGTLCCVSGATQPGLGADELRFMQVLAGIIATELDHTEKSRAESAARLLDRPAGHSSPA